MPDEVEVAVMELSRGLLVVGPLEYLFEVEELFAEGVASEGLQVGKIHGLVGCCAVVRVVEFDEMVALFVPPESHLLPASPIFKALKAVAKYDEVIVALVGGVQVDEEGSIVGAVEEDVFRYFHSGYIHFGTFDKRAEGIRSIFDSQIVKVIGTNASSTAEDTPAGGVGDA